MNRLILSFFFFALISFVSSQVVSPSSTISLSNSVSTVSISTSNSVSTVSISISNSVSSVSISVSNSVSTVSISISNSVSSVSISVSNSVSTATVSTSISPSITPTYTYTRSNSLVNYFAPDTVENTCKTTRGTICFKWPATVGTVTYSSFNIRFGLGYYTSNYYNYVNSVEANFYTITGLQQNSEYYIIVQGVHGTFTSPWSEPYFFNTIAVGPDGVNNIICEFVSSTSITCFWNTGTVEPTVLKALLYCGSDLETFITKMVLHHGETTVTFTGVSKGTTLCRVNFKIGYENYHTVSTNVIAYY